MALIDTVGSVTEIVGNGSTYNGAQNKPMDISDNGIEDIFSRKGIGIFLLKEGKVVVLLGIGKHIISGSGSNYGMP